jgi:nicotinamidase/pyrazinamidase
MLDRRQILAGFGTTAIATVFSSELWAAASIKPDDASALLVIDVQNCFLPGAAWPSRTASKSFP